MRQNRKNSTKKRWLICGWFFIAEITAKWVEAIKSHHMKRIELLPIFEKLTQLKEDHEKGKFWY